MDGNLADYDQILNGKKYHVKGLRNVKLKNKVLKKLVLRVMDVRMKV
jgi:hypothetical protein